MKNIVRRLLRMRDECADIMREIEERLEGGEVSASPLYGVDSAIHDTLGRLVAHETDMGRIEWRNDDDCGEVPS